MNYKKNVLLFNVFFLLLLLAGTLLFRFKPNFFTSRFQPVDILSDVLKDSSQSTFVVKHKIKNNTLSVTGGEKQDYKTFSGIINTSSHPTALFNFSDHLNALKHKKRQKIRIAYFGDSMIEGDLVTQDLRRLLQEAFGGSGVGFVPITSIVAGFRQTIGHSFSSNWKDVNFKSSDRKAINLFLSGHSFFSTENSVVTYRAVNQPLLNSFRQVSVLYGAAVNGANAGAGITANGVVYPVNAINPINELILPSNQGQELKLSINSTSIPLYGATFEGDSGIVLDNFSFRGISGIELDNFTAEYLAAVQATRPYDLLIFHYGPNLLFKPNLTDFNWYSKKMGPTLQKIKNAFPQTSILLISTADKGFSYNGTWHTAKGVLPLIDAQYTMAANTGIDFFNLYHAMGGEDAIVRWVNGDTAFANKDYTHVNHRGAKKFAEIIFNAIMKAFQEYEKFDNK